MKQAADGCMDRLSLQLMALALAAAASGVAAQGRLPACPGSYAHATWTGCAGEVTLPNGHKYVGEFKDGEYHGQGSYVWGGSTFAGEWRNGKLNGQGTYIFRDPRGELPYLDGETYVGGYKDGKRHGQGTFTSPTGWKYVGEWAGDEHSGRGVLTSPDGRTYVGAFSRGKRNGQGTVTYPDGARFVGQFMDDEAIGPGIEYRADGTVARSGVWENDFFVGSQSTGRAARLQGKRSAGAAPAPRGALVSRAKREARTKPGTVFRDCVACPEMVVIPAGSFLMGSPASEEGRDEREGPQHRVSIARPFAVGKYEITFDEWDACMRAGGCSHNPRNRGWGRGRRPVISVSWEDAAQYAKWLSRSTGKDYGLLTEAEWEYVARAGTTTAFSTGPTIDPKQANIGDFLGWTVPVGSYAANAFGLFDVHGNVSEWTQDCSAAEDYADAPADGSAWLREGCSYRITRGGFWGSSPQAVRSAARDGSEIEVGVGSTGFRLARTLE